MVCQKGTCLPPCACCCVLPALRRSVFAICRRCCFSLVITFLGSLVPQGQRDGEVEEEKREKPKATFEGEKLKELTEGEADVIGDVINPNGLPVQNGLDVDVKEFG